MKSILPFIISFLFFSPIYSLSGRATTTRYCDNSKGACGCGEGTDHWSRTTYTAAPSSGIFGSGSWCGSGCGRCFRLTSEGVAPSGQGTGGGKGQFIDIMVTNFCPDYGWCAPIPNKYGFDFHFDLMDCHSQISNLGWDNPIVTFEEIDCSNQQKSSYSTCECHTSSFIQ